MDKRNIILIGGGGHCKSCIDAIESSNQYEIVGILDMPDQVGKEISGYKIIGTDDDLEQFKSQAQCATITVGQIKSAELRKKLYDKIVAAGFEVPAIVASTAVVSRTAQIGDGTVVLHQAMVNSYASIGENCIINTKALIEHDAQVGNHCHISTASVLNGEAKIGDEAFLGSSSVVGHGIKIASNSIIGMGSVVNKNIEEAGTYFGNPAKRHE